MTRPDLDAIFARTKDCPPSGAMPHTRLVASKEDVRALITYCRELEAARDSLFEAVEHGDQEHRDWLSKAIDDHFSGNPVDRPAGKGTQERIRELEAENKRLREEGAGDAQRRANWLKAAGDCGP